MLAEAAGAVALKRKERVKQPGLIHARENLVFLQKVHGIATAAEVVRESSTRHQSRRWYVSLSQVSPVPECVAVGATTARIDNSKA